MEGPSGNRTRTSASAGVVHARFAVDPVRPWKGLPPTAYATATGSLLANLEQRLGQEAGGPVGSVVALPMSGFPGADGDAAPAPDPLQPYRENIDKLKGGVMLAETTASGWGEGMPGAPRTDWKPNRIGAAPPLPVVSLRSDAANAVLAACGVPMALVTDADGTSQREAYRRFVMAALEPVAAMLARELSEKLETRVELGFRALWAHDMAGRAQAYRQLRQGDMKEPDARNLAGLEA